jgi:hypothetical protein
MGGAASENAPPVNALIRAAPVGVVCLSRLLCPAHPRTFQYLQRGRARHGERAVGSLDDAGPHRQGTAAHGIRIQEVQGHTTPDHVDDGVHRPDLVEGNVIRVLTVNRALGDRQQAKGLNRARRGPVRKIRVLYQSADVPEGAVGVLLGVSDVALNAPMPLTSACSVARSKATPRA